MRTGRASKQSSRCIATGVIINGGVSLTGCEPAAEELALEWLKEDKAVMYWKLLNNEDQYRGGLNLLEGPREFTVVEKTDAGGRRLSREVFKIDELTNEEGDKEWDKMMRDDGFYDEIEWLMAKE